MRTKPVPAYPGPRPPSPQCSLQSPVWSRRERRVTRPAIPAGGYGGRTVRREDAGQVVIQQLFGHDAWAAGRKGKKGHVVSAALSLCWPQRLLVLSQPQGSGEQSWGAHCSMAAGGEELADRYRGAARPEAHQTWALDAFVSSFSFPQHKVPPPSPASPYL